MSFLRAKSTSNASGAAASIGGGIAGTIGGAVAGVLGFSVGGSETNQNSQNRRKGEQYLVVRRVKIGAG